MQMSLNSVAARLLVPAAIVAIAAVACSSSSPSNDPVNSAVEATTSGPANSTAEPTTSGPANSTAEPTTSGPAAAREQADAPLISEPEWVRGRLQTIQGVWGFTPDGIDWQNSYDLRQMRGQPAWFGSTGSNGWAGAGQAIPHSVMHELGHSYWGRFPVDGRPDLAPGPPGQEAGDIRRIVEAYRGDLLTFMRQPPDRFEPLRDRFRNLPNLDRGDLPDLAHFGEAEIVYFTGGDIDLVPPILRKYYSSYLTSDGVAGDLPDWAAALAWWFGLDDEQRDDAGQVFGLQHFPLDPYENVAGAEDAELSAAISSLLEGEERQRLVDFADQFDEIKTQRSALTDATGTDRGFNFWARYLRDMFELHSEYPDVLAGGSGARGRELGATLDAYRDLDPLPPNEQAARYRALSGESGARDSATVRDFRDFAPLLKARTLLELFPAGSEAGTESVEAAASAYADELRALVAIADAALDSGSTDPVAAAAALADQLSEFSDDELAGRIDTIFDTMRESEPEIAREVIAEIPDLLLLRLLDVRPSAARAVEIPPERLLNAAGVTPGASPNALVKGIALLSENSSGNFAIDKPFDEAMYALLDGIAGTDPDLVLRVFAETDLRPLPWVAGHGEQAVTVLGADPIRSAVTLGSYDGPEPTAERIVRRLAYADAETAATLLLAFLEVGRADVLTGTLNSIAYDAYWDGLGAGPAGRLESAAALLLALRDRLGEGQTAGLVGGGVPDYLAAVAAGELEPEYRSRHLDTLRELARAASSIEDERFFESLSVVVRDA